MVSGSGDSISSLVRWYCGFSIGAIVMLLGVVAISLYLLLILSFFFFVTVNCGCLFVSWIYHIQFRRVKDRYVYIHTYIHTYSKSLINDVVIGASLPVDVDPSQRELYLENETFKKLFGMDKVR